MAATSAGHIQPQKQHQPTQQQQQKMSSSCNMNRSSPQQQQQQPQLHNMQQQQQYALKQQQHNYNMQQQQQMHHQIMQQQHLKMQQQQQQHQQMYQNSQDSALTHMKPCQNYMTPMPQTHNKFAANLYTNNTSHYQQQFTNHHRAMPSTHHQQQHVANLPTGLVSGNGNNNTTRSTAVTCIPPNVVAPSSANQNMYPNQNHNNSCNMKQQHNYNNNNNVLMTPPEHQEYFNQQEQNHQIKQNQKQQQQLQSNSQININTNNSRLQLNAKQYVANNNNNNNDNSSCNANCNTTNLNGNFIETNGSQTNGLHISNNNNNNNNHIDNHHSMSSGVKANIPPGWRRLTNNNNEIVYISPTGSTLRSPFQIKDYLLSPGTCKCGLPCPLQPEYFFDFNVQVPNTPLTMQTYQSNEFNASTFYSSLTSAAASASADSQTSCSTQQSALMTSTESSNAFVDTTSSSSSSSSLFSSFYSSASIPSATSPSSLTCLHLKRFLDCQQLHANPTESLTKDAKRRKTASSESTFFTTASSPALSPAATTQTSTATISSDTKSIFASDSGSGMCGLQHETSHNSSFKMLPPNLKQMSSQQQQPQHEQHLSNQHEMQQQYMPTNPTYNNNSMMGSTNKIWPKDERILPTATVVQQHESHATPSTQHIRTIGENEDKHTQWSPNICNKPQDICQTKHQQQQQRTMPSIDTNTKEEFQRQIDDLNGYLQRQTTIVHNSLMSFEANTQNEHTLSEKVALENEVEDDEEDEEGEEDEEDEEEAEGDGEELEEEQENEDDEEVENKHLKDVDVVRTSNSLTDCTTYQEINTKNDNQESNIEEEANEEVDNNDDDNDDNEDPTDALDDEHVENDCESNIVSSKQSIFDKNSSLNSTNSANFYQMSLSQNQNIKQQPLFTNIQNILSPGQTTLPNKLSFTAAGIKNPIQNLFRQHASQQQHSVRGSIKLVSTAQESPVSSSTVVGSRSTPDLQRKTPDNIKKPEQVGAISTSNESPKPCPPSPAGSVESTSSKASNSKPALSPLTSPITMLHLKTNQQPGSILQKPPPQQVRILRHIKNAGHIQQPQRLAATNTSRATVTTIAGNRGAATTTTTTSASAQRIIPSAPSPSPNLKLSTPMQKLTTNSTTTSIPISQLQLQPLLRSNDNTGNSQIIMTSTGQLIVMPSTNNKPHIQQQQQQHQQQVIIASGNATTTTQSQATTNVIIQQQDVLNNAQQLTTATLQQQSNGSYIVSQPANNQSTTAQLQPATVILNSGQNLITNNGTKVLTNTGNIIHAASAQPILTTTNQLLSTPTNTSQQTVVLNALPNGGYVIQQQQPQTAQATAQTQQQQFATLDGQVIQHLVQQPDGRIIITSSGDPKRKPKKRKTSPSPATNNGTTISTQISPTMPSQTATLLQQHVANLQASTQPAQTATQPQVVQLTTTPAANAATTATYPQQFQLGNGIQGIVVNKPAANTTTTQPQQILLQNGQIIQPMNLIGQQLILPTGLVMTPDTTLLQIQNVGSCGPTTNILTTTPQGAMMLRATSPQTNKQFIQSATTGQQFIVGSNGQLSPIGQIYSTPMGLVMPASTQHNPTATATFVQQNATAIQVQPSHHQQVSTAPQHITLQALQQHPQSLTQQQQHVVQNQVGIVLETAATSTTSPNNHLISTRSAAASPPDTTTHSPRSPERPPSHRSGGSDMVQCVSSSEPDGGTISPLSSDSRQSPSTTVCDKGNVMSTAYQNANIYKPTEAKTRRVQTPPQYQVIGTGGGNNGASGTTTITNTSQMTGLTNLTLQQHNPQQHQQHSADNNNGGNNKSETHDSPQYSPNTTLMITPPPPSRTPTPQQQGLQNANTVNIEYQPSQQQQSQLRTPTKNGNGRNRNRVFKNMARDVKSLNSVDNIEVQASSSSSPPLAANLQRSFAVGELIWGPSRGFPAWPGKIVKVLDNQSESVWVQWFGGGGRSNTEIMAIHLLQSLSEGLEAHHKAQKDTRKSRKLNSQLEKAIQEAMTELDRISASSTSPTTAMTVNKQVQQPTSSTQHQGSPANRANKRPIPRTGGYELIAGLTNSNTSSNVISTTTGLSQSRHKPIRIAPAPPPTAGASNSPTKSSTTASSTGNQIANSSSSAASLSSSSLAK